MIIFVPLSQKIWITPCAAVMDQMLDIGFWFLDCKRKLSLFSSIQYPVSSIQYLSNCGINDRFQDVVIFGSGLFALLFN
jgi:hypothetical protein